MKWEIKNQIINEITNTGSFDEDGLILFIFIAYNVAYSLIRKVMGSNLNPIVKNGSKSYFVRWLRMQINAFCPIKVVEYFHFWKSFGFEKHLVKIVKRSYSC